jgi:mannitol-1-phosphate 5-dehydrogenase
MKKSEAGKKPVMAVIGAGKTGRGFIARLAKDSPYQIVFIDNSTELVNKLNEDGSYAIHFFGGQRPPVSISGFTAVSSSSQEAVDYLAQAELIITSVGEQHLPQVAETLKNAFALKKTLQRKSPSYVLTCENGVSPASVLSSCLAGHENEFEHVYISEAAIFCSTVELADSRLDIVSECYDKLPYDSDRLHGFVGFTGMEAVSDFKTLLLRKIYTYNCISACIAYLGAVKGYEMYADAANDPDIRSIIFHVLNPLNSAICKKLNVDPHVQQQFSQNALDKFSDANIKDDIPRNARDVIRKLGPNDRLIAPSVMIMEIKGDYRGLALVIASALIYGKKHENKLRDMLAADGAAAVFGQLSGLSEDHPLTAAVVNYYCTLTEYPGDLTTVSLAKLI